MQRIEEPTAASGFALFELGFRPFFAAAGVFAVVVMLAWMLMYVFAVRFDLAGLAPVSWHAHEMVYGYAMAVVAGFLLTAVGNWTGAAGIRGPVLGGLLILWLAGRSAYFLAFDGALLLAAVADLLFTLGLIVAVSLPVIRARQWLQLGVISKLWLMLAGNSLFYAGGLGYLDQGVRWGIYAGLYVLLALVFVMARRVLPFFIERGVGEGFVPRNRRWVDVASLVLFLAWAVLDVFTGLDRLVGWISAGLFLLHAWRLRDWYTAGIWRRPLLWSLYLAYGFLTLGFLLKALSVWQGMSPYLGLHAFAVGGIGLMTIGMMSRVALGHTGRDVFSPPRILGPLFALILLSAVARVLLPLLDGDRYLSWVATSQLLWMLGFAGFSVVYVPQLLRPRVDGRPG